MAIFEKINLPNSPIVYYGDNCLSNKIFSIINLPARSGIENDVQRLPQARADGSVLVNVRQREKVIPMTGGIMTSSDYEDNQEYNKNLLQLEYLKRILKSDAERMLRIIPDGAYKGTNLLNQGLWAGGGSGFGAQISDDTTVYSLNDRSLKVTYTGVSGTITNFSITTGTVTSVDISSYTRPFVQVDIFLPYYYTIDSVDIRVGSSNANYYSATVFKNYEGGKLKYGWNIITIDLENASITGTPNLAAMAYYRLYFTTLAQSITLYVSNPIFVDDTYVRNYPCILEGGINITESQFDLVSQDVSFNLLCTKGFGYATDPIDIISATNATKINAYNGTLAGNCKQDIDTNVKINTLNSTTALIVRNVDTGLKLTTTSTLLVNDVINISTSKKSLTINGVEVDFTGLFPNWQSGIARYELEQVTTANTPITSFTINPLGPALRIEGLYTIVGVDYSFTSPGASSKVKSITFTGTQTSSPSYIFCRILTNAGAVLATSTTQTISGTARTYTFDFDVALTASTTYRVEYNTTYYTGLAPTVTANAVNTENTNYANITVLTQYTPKYD